MSQQPDDDELTIPLPSNPRPIPPLPLTPPDQEDDDQAGRTAPRRRPSTTLYVSPGLQRRFDRYRQRNRAHTNTSVVLEAIVEHHDELREIIEAAKISTSPVAKNDVFPDNEANVRYLGSGNVQIQISPTPAQLKKLDELTEILGFGRRQRSTWIAPVLNHFLPGHQEQQRTNKGCDQGKSPKAAMRC